MLEVDRTSRSEQPKLKFKYRHLIQTYGPQLDQKLFEVLQCSLTHSHIAFISRNTNVTETGSIATQSPGEQ